MDLPSHTICCYSYQEAINQIHNYEVMSKSKFCISKGRNFNFKANGNDIDSLKNYKVRWEDNLNLPNIPFDGIPFIIIGNQTRSCQHGPTRYRPPHKKTGRNGDTPEISHTDYMSPKRKARPNAKNVTKKLNCKSVINIRTVLKFPEYKVEVQANGQINSWHKEKKSYELTRKFSFETKKEFRVYVNFPSVKDHNHPLIGEIDAPHQGIDRIVIEKIHELVTVGGVTQTEQVKNLLQMFVKENILPAYPDLSPTDPRFYPSNLCIKNHIKTALKKQRVSDPNRVPETPVPGSNTNIQIVSIDQARVVSQFYEPNFSLEPSLDEISEPPPSKKSKRDTTNSIDMEESIKAILLKMNQSICSRLDDIDKKLYSLDQKNKYLQSCLDKMAIYSNNPTFPISDNIRKETEDDAPSPTHKTTTEDLLPSDDLDVEETLGPNVTYITLNSESDYPQGCWLGDDSNPEMRVRTPISINDLYYIHSNCQTPEKMALALLDYLFDRETQAESNIAGINGKNELDPLMMYGIRCHLIHRFNLMEDEWDKIEETIDSKCNAVFDSHHHQDRSKVSLDKIAQTDHPPIKNPVSLIHNYQRAIDMQELVQVEHASPKLIPPFRYAPHLQILQSNQLQQLPSRHITPSAEVTVIKTQLEESGTQEANAAMETGEANIHIATVTTDSGEIVHIKQAPAPNITIPGHK